MSGIDWNAVHARVDRIGEALRGRAPTAEEAARVLEERAVHLARPLAAEEVEGAIGLATFALAGERYGIEARWVVEVARLSHLTPLPGAEPPLFGVTAWRGDLLTLYDLRSVLGLPARALDDMKWIVVLGEGRAAFGILADEPGEFVELPPQALEVGGARRPSLVLGVTPDALVVLDGARVMAEVLGSGGSA